MNKKYEMVLTMNMTLKMKSYFQLLVPIFSHLISVLCFKPQGTLIYNSLLQLIRNTRGCKTKLSPGGIFKTGNTTKYLVKVCKSTTTCFTREGSHTYL